MRALEADLRACGAGDGFASADAVRAGVAGSRPAEAQPSAALAARFDVERHALGGRIVFTLVPRDAVPLAHVLCFHGGAFVYEMSDPQWGLLGELMGRVPIALTLPLFPLAPERRAREIAAFVRHAYGAFHAAALGSPTVVLGMSAGGALTLRLDRTLRERGEPQPDALLLVSPGLDLSCSDAEQPQLARVDPLLALAGLREAGRMYAGDLALDDPRVSPLFGDLAGLPRTLVLAGDHDVLVADARRLAARAASPTLTLREYAGAIHMWLERNTPESAAALDEAAAFVRITASAHGLR